VSCLLLSHDTASSSPWICPLAPQNFCVYPLTSTLRTSSSGFTRNESEMCWYEVFYKNGALTFRMAMYVPLAPHDSSSSPAGPQSHSSHPTRSPPCTGTLSPTPHLHGLCPPPVLAGVRSRRLGLRAPTRGPRNLLNGMRTAGGFEREAAARCHSVRCWRTRCDSELRYIPGHTVSSVPRSSRQCTHMSPKISSSKVISVISQVVASVYRRNIQDCSICRHIRQLRLSRRRILLCTPSCGSLCGPCMDSERRQ
jgi:hypothetical protein